MTVPTTRMQIEAADLILLNKVDLVSSEEVSKIQGKLHQLNGAALVLPTQRCQVDPDLLFGIVREREIRRPEHLHQREFESFSYAMGGTLKRNCFEEFANHLIPSVYRAKGFIRFSEGTHLFNFVAGRWELEPFREEKTALVFIGRGIKSQQPSILAQLTNCEG